MLRGILPGGYGIAIDPTDMRALTSVELQQQILACAALARQHVPSLAELSAQQNFRREPFVPPGWAEWSASEWRPI